jgi:hypothetical protein
MQHQHGGKDITGRTAAQHVKACEGGGGSMQRQQGGNSKTGRTAAQHAMESSAGRATMHGDALNILRANWNALPISWHPTAGSQRVKRNPEGGSREGVMLGYLLSIYHEDVPVPGLSGLRSAPKLERAGRYNKRFRYMAGDPGFLVSTTDGRGGCHPKKALYRAAMAT